MKARFFAILTKSNLLCQQHTTPGLRGVIDNHEGHNIPVSRATRRILPALSLQNDLLVNCFVLVWSGAGVVLQGLLAV